jgi:hypothetical protein
MIQIRNSLGHASSVSVYLEYTRNLKLDVEHTTWAQGTSTEIDMMLRRIRLDNDTDD